METIKKKTNKITYQLDAFFKLCFRNLTSTWKTLFLAILNISIKARDNRMILSQLCHMIKDHWGLFLRIVSHLF